MANGDPDTVVDAAARLVAASRDRKPCAPVRDLIGPHDVAAAYAVQRRVIAGRLSSGARVVGRKIGLTNPAVQRQLGVDQPDFGMLLDDMDVSAVNPVPLDHLLQPKIEAEIAFGLCPDLPADWSGPVGSTIPLAVVRDAIAFAAAALEIVDSRVEAWDISIADTVADNASSGLYVLGTDRQPLSDAFLPVDVTMSMTRDGEVVSSGSGAACLGDPLLAVAWLAAAVRDFGSPLAGGEVILSGALGPMVVVEPGATYEAQLSGLGSVRTSFSSVAGEAGYGA